MNRSIFHNILPAVLLLAGCDRPFEPVAPATIQVLEPDFSEVQTEPTVSVQLQVESSNDVAGIRVGSVDFSNTGSGTWMGQLQLDKGYNFLEIETFTGDEPIATDTVHAFLMPFERELTSDFLSVGLGGHTTTLLDDGSLLTAGGTTHGANDAHVGMYVKPPDGPTESLILSPRRVGHTATYLPDGRVLFLGGGFYGNVFEVFELTQVASLFDPEDQSVTQVEIVGDPIRRMYHTSVLRQEGTRLFIDLYGGRGDIAYGDNPRLGIRSDLRTFEFAGGTLHALHPAIGPFISPMAGHSQTPLQEAPSATTRHLLAGFSYDGSIEPAALFFERSSIGLIHEPAPLPPTPTIRHAAIRLADGVVALFGGRHPETDAIPESASVIYVDEAKGYFRLPSALIQDLIPRYGHTATRLPDGRILLSGGYGADGLGIADAELLTFDLN